MENKTALIPLSHAQSLVEAVKYFETHPEELTWNGLSKENIYTYVLILTDQKDIQRAVAALEAYVDWLLDQKLDHSVVPPTMQELVDEYNRIHPAGQLSPKTYAELRKTIRDALVLQQQQRKEGQEESRETPKEPPPAPKEEEQKAATKEPETPLEEPLEPPAPSTPPQEEGEASSVPETLATPTPDSQKDYSNVDWSGTVIYSAGSPPTGSEVSISPPPEKESQAKKKGVEEPGQKEPSQKPKKQVYLVRSEAKNPSLVSVVKKPLLSLAVKPLQTLHTLASEELRKQNPSDEATTNLLWQQGVDAKNLNEAAEKFASENLDKESQETAVALKTQAEQIKYYEETKPLLARLFKAFHEPERHEVKVISGEKEQEEIARLPGKKLQLSYDNSGVNQITSIPSLSGFMGGIRRGINFSLNLPVIKQAAGAFGGFTRGFFQKTLILPVANKIKSAAGKIAASALTKLGLTALTTAGTAAAAVGTGGLSLLAQGALLLGKKLLGWVGGLVGNFLGSHRFAFPRFILGGLMVAAPFIVPALSALALPLAVGGAALMISSVGFSAVASAVGGVIAGVGGVVASITTGVAVTGGAVASLIGGVMGIPILGSMFTNNIVPSANIGSEDPRERYPDFVFPATRPEGPGVEGVGLSFIWPAPFKACTSNYGKRLIIIGGRTQCEPHMGVDMSASLWSSIVTAERGQVVAKSRDRVYGNYVIIKHPGVELYTLYGHFLSTSPAPAVGQDVSKGQIIGYTGSTGRSTGSHLHITFSTCGSVRCFDFGTVDPCQYLSGEYSACEGECGYRSECR